MEKFRLFLPNKLKLLLLLFFSLKLLALFDTALADKLVTTSLDANWVHTSFIAETSEFLATEDPSGNLFWKFIDKLIDDDEQESEETKQNISWSQENEFERALSFTSSLLPDSNGSNGLSLLRFALALRLYSPRIQLHRQIVSELLPLLSAQNCDQNKPFYEVNGAISCVPTEIESLLKSANQRQTSPIYSIDHVYPNNGVPKEQQQIKPVAILYADIGNSAEEHSEIHKILSRLSTEGRLQYVLRHFDGKTSSLSASPSSLVSLSGYGVELAIKSTEYKAIDDANAKNDASGEEEAPTNLHGFNFKTLRENYVHLRDQLGQFQMHLSELDELAPLKQWEIADIGMQAAQRVMNAAPEEALPLLIDLAQNFPIRARSLVQTKVRQSFREEIGLNQQQWAQELEMTEGESSLWINGIHVAMDVEQLDLFQLYQTLSQEQRLANAFMQIGFKREYQSILRAMDLSEDKPGTWAIDFRDAKPEWLNNLDKDKQYADWGNSVRLLLQPYFPGMIRPIARNLFTLVCIVDPASADARSVLKTVFSLYAHNVPLRIGLVFVVDDSPNANGKNDVGVALYNIFQFVKTEKSPAKAAHFLQQIFDELGDGMDLDGLHRFFQRHYTDQEIDDVFALGSDYDSGRSTGMAFYRRSGLQKLPTILVNGVPLDQSAVLESPERFEEAIIVTVMRQTGALQRAVISGKLTDRENVQNWVMSQPDVLNRLNPILLGETGSDQQKKKKKTATTLPPIYSQAECQISEKSKNMEEFSPEQRTQCLMKQQRYLVRSDEGEQQNDGKNEDAHWLSISIWLIGDLGTEKGQQLVRNALKALKKSNQMRLTIIHNGPQMSSSFSSIPLLIDAIQTWLPSTAAKQALNKLFGSDELLKEANEALKAEESSKKFLEKIAGHGVNMEPVFGELKAKKGQHRLALQQAFSAYELGLAVGQRAILANGQIYGPLGEAEQFEIEDFGLMEKLAERQGAKIVAAMVKEWQKEGKKANENPSDIVLRILSAINNFAVRKRRQSIEFSMEFESVLNMLAEDEDSPVVEITAIIDPLSRAAQKLAPILQTLLKVLNADFRLAMNPKQRLSELPLKRFYRFVLHEEPKFGKNGQVLANVAQFHELPQKQLLTMNLIVPDAWMVQPVWAEYDLDNIRVAMAAKDIVARFQLRHILLEGHCFDEQTGNPPRGLQFLLGTRSDSAMFDTIVMANLGYFQLKAGPGAWILRLREGRSKEIYELKGSGEAENDVNRQNEEENNGELTELHVLVDSFSGKTIRVRVSKRKGMEKRSLLTEEGASKDGEGGGGMDEDEEDGEDEGGSIWSNLAPKKVVKKLSSKLMGGEKYDTINIFSLASGHLYERFLRIMMLSVLKNTKHNVKFWLLNNYLSPQFRETLPVLAKHYGFDYQLIEYKWPRWLHQQTEKQRVMWGYKILFLDVLFPLDIKKFIFVDADQVVRTDMMELMEYDLQGAPYGYTPFCESRTTMDGFRFWKSGYWASHLAGRRYHISALYVVDLAKFRQIAAGDRLRGQYQGLSSDPNSLSNLDQDLPNNMIHQVRIHSLPQEWLWCETWCDDASKSKAKTIDLCNNPQTKEPKLDSAIRILPEWTEYDNEIRRVLEEVAGNKLKPDEDESKGKKTENQKGENNEENYIDDDHKKHSEL